MEKQKIGGYKAEFSLGELTYLRISKIIETIDNCAFFVGSGDYKNLKPYLASLLVLYNNIRPTYVRSDEDKAKKTDKKMNDIMKKVERANLSFQNLVNRKRMYFDPMGNDTISPNKLITEAKDELLALNREIYDIMQSIGLGVLLERIYTKKDLLAKGLGV